MKDKLSFKEIYLGIFYAFSMKGIDFKKSNREVDIDRDAAIDMLDRYADTLVAGSRAAEWDDKAPYANNFEYSQQFFLDKIPTNLIRLRLICSCSLDLSMFDSQKGQSARSRFIPIDVFLSIFPDNEIGVLFFSINLRKSKKLAEAGMADNGLTTDDLIFHIHSLFEDRFDVQIKFPDYLKKLDLADEKHRFSEIAEKYIEFILIAFGIGRLTQKIVVPSEYNYNIIKYLIEQEIDVIEEYPPIHHRDSSYEIHIEIDNPNKLGNDGCRRINRIRRDIKNISNQQCVISLGFSNIIKKRVLEIRDSGDGLNLNCAEHFLNRYPEQTYGMMVGDEGWRFVPKEFSESRISKRWGSRDFVSVVASSSGVILLNFRNTDHYSCYVKGQKDLRNLYQQKVEEHFDFDYCLSGMDHGIFLYLEKAVIMRLLLNTQRDQLHANINKFDKEKNRKRFLRFVPRIFDIRSQKRLEKISAEINKFYMILTNISIENDKWEMGEMYKIISESMDLDKDLNNIKAQLGEYFSQYYSIESNQFISNLNNWGLGIAFIGTIIGIALTIIGLYLSGAQVYSGEHEYINNMNVSENFIKWLVTYVDPRFI